MRGVKREARGNEALIETFVGRGSCLTNHNGVVREARRVWGLAFTRLIEAPLASRQFPLAQKL